MRTIVFDFGNVVGFFDHTRALERLAAYTEMPVAAMRRLIYEGDLEDAYEAGRITSEQFLSCFRERCALSCDPDTIAAAFADVFEPNLAVCGLLPSLSRKYRLLLGSNTNELHSIHFRRQFAEHLEHFSGIVLSHTVGARKPSPLFFEHCWRLAGCATNQCVFIDDLEANVAGARRCGWHGIVYRDVEDFKRQLAEIGIEIE
jgi:putative hydrolase of the HAD superfamily